MNPDDDFVDSPFVELAEYGNDKSYNHAEKKQEKWEMPKRDYDDLDVKLGIIDKLPPEPINEISSLNPAIERVEGMELRWAWNYVSNAEAQGEERNKLRYGKLITASQNYTLWGMATWYEAKRHIHVLDKPMILPIWEEIVYEVSQRSKYAGDYRSCIWCARSENQTQAGFWIISIESESVRELLIYANQQLISKSVPIRSQNRIKISS